MRIYASTRPLPSLKRDVINEWPLIRGDPVRSPALALATPLSICYIVIIVLCVVCKVFYLLPSVLTYLLFKCGYEQRSFTRWTLHPGCRRSLLCLSVLRCRCEPVEWRSPATEAVRGLPARGPQAHYRQVSSDYATFKK